MKKRTTKKMQKHQSRYELHRYLKYVRQWLYALIYKEQMYTLLGDGKIIKEKY